MAQVHSCSKLNFGGTASPYFVHNNPIVISTSIHPFNFDARTPMRRAPIWAAEREVRYRSIVFARAHLGGVHAAALHTTNKNRNWRAKVPKSPSKRRANATQRRSSVRYWFTRRMPFHFMHNAEISHSNPISLCDQHFPSHVIRHAWNWCRKYQRISGEAPTDDWNGDKPVRFLRSILLRI